jgi:hypothetical protein
MNVTIDPAALKYIRERGSEITINVKVWGKG